MIDRGVIYQTSGNLIAYPENDEYFIYKKH